MALLCSKVWGVFVTLILVSSAQHSTQKELRDSTNHSKHSSSSPNICDSTVSMPYLHPLQPHHSNVESYLTWLSHPDSRAQAYHCWTVSSPGNRKKPKHFLLEHWCLLDWRIFNTEKLSAFLPSALWQDINHSLQTTVYQLRARSQRELQTSLASLNSSIYLIPTVSLCLVILLCLDSILRFITLVCKV